MPEVELEINYDSIDSIPEGFRGLYDEADGKYTLSGVVGMKSQADIDRLNTSIRKEREDHKKTKENLSPWSSLGSLEEVQAKLDRIQELEAAAEGNLDDDKINKIVEGRLSQKTGPLNRQLETISSELETVKTENEKLRNSIETRDRNEAVRSVATEMEVVPTALPDIVVIAANYLERNEEGKFVTKSDIDGITPGVDIKQFFKEMQKSRPHWWPASEGAGAYGKTGSADGTSNPWKADSWNVTAQGNLIRSDRSLADRLAKAAGTFVGGPRPQAK